MPPPPVSRILETSLYVADLDRSRAFYNRIFGFETLMQDERMCALAVPARQVLLLFRHGATDASATTPFGVIPAHHGAGHMHLCFSIPLGAVPEWRAHLASEAVTIESEIAWPRGGTSLYFRDPDDHSLEVATAGLWANDAIPGGVT